VQVPPRDAHHAIAGGHEDAVAQAVALESAARVVGVVSVQLDDEARLPPQAVGPDPPPRQLESEVDCGRRWQVGVGDEGEEGVLELTAGDCLGAPLSGQNGAQHRGARTARVTVE
jgi:hypothetical protein